MLAQNWTLKLTRQFAKMPRSAAPPTSAKASPLVGETQTSVDWKMTSSKHYWNETRLRVRYAETDQMGVVYHSNHLIWFEVGRVELMREMGFSYKDMEKEDGLFIGVAEATCRYRAPAYYDEEVLVRTRIKNVRESVVIFNYELCRAETGALLAEGETTHVVTDSNMKVSALPERYLRVFRAAIGK